MILIKAPLFAILWVIGLSCLLPSMVLLLVVRVLNNITQRCEALSNDLAQ